MRILLSSSLPVLFFLFVITGITSFGINARWGLWQSHPILFMAPAALLGTVLIGHAISQMGIVRSLLFFIISGAIALIAEHIAIIYQPLGAYEFNLKSSWSIGKVPVMVLIAWCFFIYIGYAVSNAGWAVWVKKSTSTPRPSSMWEVGLLVLMDIWLITSVDLMVDPVQRFEKNWTWVNGGAFFGVPPGNFLGWMAVVGVATLIFRSLQFFYPPKARPLSIHYWIPVTTYLLIAFFYLYAAHKYFGWPLTIIGMLTMLPVPTYIILRGRHNSIQKKGILY